MHKMEIEVKKGECKYVCVYCRMGMDDDVCWYNHQNGSKHYEQVRKWSKIFCGAKWDEFKKFVRVEMREGYIEYLKRNEITFKKVEFTEEDESEFREKKERLSIEDDEKYEFMKNCGRREEEWGKEATVVGAKSVMLTKLAKKMGNSENIILCYYTD